MEDGKKFSTSFIAASDAPKYHPIGYQVTIRCAACEKETALKFKPGQFTRDYVESSAELMIGRSRFFVIPVELDDPGPLGRCAHCSKRPLTFTVEEYFDDVDIEAGKLNFTAYCEAVDGVTHDKRPIPTWDNLTPAVRRGWILSAFVVKASTTAFNFPKEGDKS